MKYFAGIVVASLVAATAATGEDNWRIDSQGRVTYRALPVTRGFQLAGGINDSGVPTPLKMDDGGRVFCSNN
jgi:hypothetical protein